VNILEQANNLINGDRAKDYGSTLDNFGRIAKMWSAILGVEVTPEQHVLCMLAVKMARLCNSPKHMDSIVDIAGYAGTYEKLLSELATKEKP
jgi:hypothetical protein